MKTTIKANLILAAFLQMLFISTALLAQFPPSASWSFDETSDSILIDASGNNNTAYTNSALRVSGVKGNCLSFNGTSSYAYALNSTSLSITNQVTIECWVKLRQTEPVSGSGQTFIRKERAYALGIGSGGKVGFQICDQNGGWHGPWTLSRQQLTSSQWYHVAAVWNGQTMKVYVNGTEDLNIFTYTGSGPSPSNINNVYIGEFYESKYERLNGMLDELKVYSFALPADSIIAHYNAVSPTPPIVLIPCEPNPTYNQKPVLKWFANSSISEYLLQISSNRLFSSLIVSFPTIDTSYTPLVNLPGGDIFWRVCSFSDTTTWSAVSSFTIQDSSVPIIIPYSPDPTLNKKPELTWHPVEGASNYTFQISIKPDFSSLFIVDAIADTFYIPLVNLPEDTIFWRVKSNLDSIFSPADTFIILNDSIPILIKMTPFQNNQRPVFEWHPGTGATSYRIQIDTIGTFLNPFISMPVTDTTYSPSTDLPYGIFFWRVSSNTSETRYSDVDTFTITPLISNKKVPSDFRRNTESVNISRNPYGVSVAFHTLHNSSISIGIHSLNGKLLRTISRENVPAGNFNLTWDGTDKTGRQLPCGSYFVSCAINSNRVTKIINLVR
jgi:hypothetical protein